MQFGSAIFFKTFFEVLNTVTLMSHSEFLAVCTPMEPTPSWAWLASEPYIHVLNISSVQGILGTSDFLHAVGRTHPLE